jgi:hypothetical protein
MYNEAFLRAVLADRACDREAAMSLARLRRDEPARDRRRPIFTFCAYLRGIPASVRRTAMKRRRQPNRDDARRALADA